MRCARWISVLALAVTFTACERPRTRPVAGVTTTTTRQASEGPGPATAPASLPADSCLLIADRPVQFPRTRMVVLQQRPQLLLLLFSDDPRDALTASYRGNRYYFEISLDIDDPVQLGVTDWHYRASSMQRIDSPNGVFLNGDTVHLQPYELSIVFNRAGPHVVAHLQGQFLRFPVRGEVQAPILVAVSGVLIAELEQRGGAAGKLRSPAD